MSDPAVRLQPMTDHIGSYVIRHGERDDLDPAHPDACLCGHPYYLHCPGWIDSGGLAWLTLYPSEAPGV